MPKTPVEDGLASISGSELGDQPVEAALGVFEDLVEVLSVGVALDEVVRDVRPRLICDVFDRHAIGQHLAQALLRIVHEDLRHLHEAFFDTDCRIGCDGRCDHAVTFLTYLVWVRHLWPLAMSPKVSKNIMLNFY